MMNPITQLHNLYLNKPIYIVGSDPTLEEYPDDYLDGKIGITCHLSYLKFPDATYRYFNEFDRITFLMTQDKGIMEKEVVVGYPFYSRTEEVTNRILSDFKTIWYLDNEDYPPNGDPSDIFTNRGVNAMKKWVDDARGGKSNTYGSNGTCTHNALYVALILGGNPINMIGCNYSAVDGKEHFGDANAIDSAMRPNTGSFTGYRGNRMTRGFEAIKEGAKKHDIKINRHERFTPIS